MNSKRALLIITLGLTASAVSAQPLFTSARQANSGSLKLLTFYRGVKDQTLNFTVNGNAACATQNGVPFTCGQSGDVEAEGSGNSGGVKLVWQPWERFQYYATFGVGEYSVRVPSATVTNLLTGDSRGQSYGAGFKASIVPDTIVTPAIALDLSLARSVYDFNRSFPGGTPGVGSISQRLELMTYQVAVETSHTFKVDPVELEPYGGLKWTRVQADLKDLVDGSRAGGKKDSVTPFVGLRVPVGANEAFVAEGSFIGGYHYGGGLELRFK